MILHEGYARERLARLEARLRELVYAERVAVAEMRLSPAVGRIPYEEARQLPYREVSLGEPLGPPFATQWLAVRAHVPDAWSGSPVDLLLDTRSEATVWVCGRVVQGLHSGPSQVRTEARLLERATGGEPIQAMVEIACQDTFGYGDPAQAGGTRGPFRSVSPFVLDRCELGRFDPAAWRALWDLSVLRALELEPGLDPSVAGQLLAALDRAAAAWERGDPSAGAALVASLYERFAGGGPHEVSAVGHAHLDTAWLWPLEETWRKLQRTFSTQVRLLEAYGDFVFAASQAQHYAWVAERDPALWRAIREQVQRGAWIPVGGTWIEPDCNLPAGESLARQFLYGQRFFERELGRRCTELWQPDAFGFTAQLPQLMRQAGISRFLTQKLSWNRFTAPEHHSFIWQGLDGSEVLAHFPPADTYNAEATVAEVARSARDYRDHARSGESMLVFGYGDGGGGPTAGMVERLRRMRDLRGLPRTALRAPQEFFERLEERCEGLRRIVGELYFELHRGTYTSQAAIKRGNRRCEAALRDAELICTLAARAAQAPYPRERLRELWRVLLVNQFHDILPGSSIAEVCARARRDLEEVEHGAEGLIGEALVALSALGGSRARDAEPVPFNPAPFARREVTVGPLGSPVLVAAPACGAGAVVNDAGEVSVTPAEGGGVRLENEHLVVVVDAGGRLVSLVERRSGRESLAAPGNQLELYVDDPVAWDAWDIDPAHLSMGAPCDPASGGAAVRSHPLRGEVEFERRVGERSLLRHTIRLDAGSARLEVHTVADWHERHRLLKVAFPLAVHAHFATFESAFGATVRPTHFSARQDLARFEVPGHRWVDLSEHGFGVAILTDSKYGYSVHGGTVRVSLLRGPSYPDPDADVGRHEFAYALVPHLGGWQDGGVDQQARAFTTPLRWAPPAGGSWASVTSGSLVLDTLKLAEDSSAIVLRLYEAHGARGCTRIRLGVPWVRARRSNLLEDDLGPVPVDGEEIVVEHRPWEVVTVLVD